MPRKSGLFLLKYKFERRKPMRLTLKTKPKALSANFLLKEDEPQKFKTNRKEATTHAA